ncbi:alpha-mannosidase At3g26720-like [Aristolochia californica]|uniref:alpha-mannosidase At3g26720-like n=1 Tax=Aristolochia californica TaxID=171875 RepID=UPI0035DE89BA
MRCFSTNYLQNFSGLKTIDYFAYADRANSILKGRDGSGPLGPRTASLADALALAQHHDGVSGTKKQHVAIGYAIRLYMGYSEAAELVESSLACLPEWNRSSGCRNPSTKSAQWPLLNISYCPTSEAQIANGNDLVVVVYNSLIWKRADIVRIPVTSASIIVSDVEGKEIESQLLPIANVALGMWNFYVQAQLGVLPIDIPMDWLTFAASVPPLGLRTYVVSSSESTGPKSILSEVETSIGRNGDSIRVGKGHLVLTYAAVDRKLIQYHHTTSSVKASLQQSCKYYIGDDGNGADLQASGAYIFCPNGSVAIKPEPKAGFTVFQGPVLDDVSQRIKSWISQITRVYQGNDHTEFEFPVRHLPVADFIGKEVATQFMTTMMTNKVFFTYSSGREFINRIRDYMPAWG